MQLNGIERKANDVKTIKCEKTKFHISNWYEKTVVFLSYYHFFVAAAVAPFTALFLFTSLAGLSPFMLHTKPEHRFNDFTVVI